MLAGDTASVVPNPAASGATTSSATASSATASSATGTADSAPAPRPIPDSTPTAIAGPAAEDTVRVSSPLYTYGFSTRGAKLVEATLHRYASMAPGEEGQRAQIMPEGSDLLGLTVVRGRDTVDFRDVVFTPSADSLAVQGDTQLRLTAERNGVRLELTYAFSPDDYRVRVSGRASDIGPNGGMLLVGMWSKAVTMPKMVMMTPMGAMNIMSTPAMIPERRRRCELFSPGTAMLRTMATLPFSSLPALP